MGAAQEEYSRYVAEGGSLPFGQWVSAAPVSRAAVREHGGREGSTDPIEEGRAIARPYFERAQELAAVPLAQAGSVALAATPTGIGPRDALALGEKAGLVKRREAPPADPDKPEAGSEEAPPLGQASEGLPIFPRVGVGVGRAPSPSGQQQAGKHVVEGRAVPQEAKDLYERGFQSQLEGVAANDKALEREGQSREAWAENQASEMDKLEMRRQLLAKQKEDALKALDDQVKARLDEARSPGVVANRTVGRLVSGIGLALGAYSASMRGGPNLALQIYQQHVNEEAAELERQAKHEENLYSRMYRSFGDKEQALAMTRAALHERGLFEIGKIEAAAKTEHGRAALKGLAGQLQSSRGDNISRTAEIESDKVERTASESAHVFGPMLRDPLSFHGAQAEAPAGEATSGEAYDAVRGAVQEAHAAVQKSQGPTGGWLPTEGQIRVAQEAAAEEAPGPQGAPAPAVAPGQRRMLSFERDGAPAPGPAAPAGPAKYMAGRNAQRASAAARLQALVSSGQLTKKDYDAAMEQYQKWAHDNAALVDSITAARQVDGVFPTGKSADEIGDVLTKARNRGLDFADVMANQQGKEGSPTSAAIAGVASLVGHGAKAKIYDSFTAKEKAQLQVFNELRASVIRARAGATLSPSEKQLYDKALGSSNVEDLRAAFLMLKGKLATQWNSQTRALSGHNGAALLMMEKEGQDTRLDPNVRWSR